ncbi:MAG TPA: TAT-variant-translocated molybdopterin oxidoreductase, partial [Tepidisphaeraceae bacterium]|nr:TAT-variant-translocated molybdopterin oxidoreductase [Tepidisphaeraceae bacterium]
MREGPEQLDLNMARERAAKLPGDALWRSLEELAGTRQFRESVEREFPSSVHKLDNGFSRRNFMRLMGASMALAGVYGCSERPSKKILPYVRQPEQIVPGMPLFFATTMPLNGYGYGVLAQSYEGRPTKIEGNPDHPASLGATNVMMQASVLQLYDPERGKDVTRAGDVRSWQAFREDLLDRVEAKRASGGKGVRLLTGTVTSPTLAWQLNEFLKQFPQAKWHHYDPMARVNTREGARQALGRPVNTVHQFRRFGQNGQHSDAKVIVSLDSDFLWDNPASLQYARHFAEARKVRVRHWWQTTMSRLYVVESTFSLTGSMADHRIPARPSDVAAFARAIAARLGVQGISGEVPGAWSKHLDAIISDLQKNKGESIVLVGESQPPEIHALGHAINAALGNLGQDKTVYHIDPVEALPPNHPENAFDSLRELTDDIRKGGVDTLLILGENPVYTAPGDIRFDEALLNLSRPQQPSSAEYVGFTAHLGPYQARYDETSYRCQWHVPEAHYLESWGDVRAFDGTISLIQPVIEPIFGGKSAVQMMDVLLTPPSQIRDRTSYEIVREYWRHHSDLWHANGKNDEATFEAWWNSALQKGVIDGTKSPAVQVQVSGNLSAAAPTAATIQPAATQPAGGLDVVFRPDPSIWDGSFANNGWLQETPKFLTKLVWDNAALVSPNTAQMLRERHGDISDGHYLHFTSPDGLAIDAPLMILPGVPDNVVLMTFGYGRQQGGSTAMDSDGNPRGYRAYALRSSRSPWTGADVSTESTGRWRELVVTRNHYAMDTLPKWGRADEQGRLKPQAIEHPEPEEHAEDREQHEQDEMDREIHNRKLIRTTTLEYFNESPEHRDFVRELGADPEKPENASHPLSIYPGWDYSKGYQWGMSIDVQSCIGCNSCLVACVAENNIAVVGREEVSHQREMHWIRIDSYFGSNLTKQQIEQGEDPLKNPQVYHQPIPCMQCENAPCELVCPVGATVHSPEGLNDMVYNRCVGTRYCSNNCPYKVRRFNFLLYQDWNTPSLHPMRNPDVTVRSRGVMEKCTYCVQRINQARIDAKRDER